MKKSIAVFLVLCFLGNPVMGMRFTDAGKRAADITNAELGLASIDLAGELDIIDMKLNSLSTRVNLLELDKVKKYNIKMDKTESLVLFFVKAGLCLWGFNNGTTYGYVTGVIFGIGAGKDIGTAVYE